jgi:heptosyltransferase-2
MSDPRRIAVFLPNWVGDAVMATPALRALRERFPDARIDWLGKGICLDVLTGLPWADSLRPDLSLGAGLGGLMRMSRHIRRQRYDLAVLLPNSFRTAALAWSGGARRRIGYARDGRRWLLTEAPTPPRDAAGRLTPISAVRYYLSLVERLGCAVPAQPRMELAAPESDIRRADTLLTRAGVAFGTGAAPGKGPTAGGAEPGPTAGGEAPSGASGGPLVMLNPGASFGTSKLWPAERYAALADALARGRGARILINAAPGEADLARAVASAMETVPAVNLADEDNSLGLLKALLGRCDLLVTNDTGARHVAAAMGAAVVTVFGSTDPRWAQIDYPRERICRAEHVPCSPCQQKTCPKPPGRAHLRCLWEVPVADVLAAAETLLDEPTRDAPRRRRQEPPA